MAEEKLQILYCDDQREFRDEFAQRHAKRGFRIRPEKDISEVLSTLRRCAPDGLPDLLMLDLYHDIDSTSADREKRLREANAALRDLDETLQRVKRSVERAWTPTGLDVLEEVREEFSPEELPIMIYSQRGLFFLDEDQLERVEKADAEWMLKDRGELYEARRIRRMTEEKPERRMARDIVIAAVSVLAGGLLSWLLQVLG